ncbi:MAG: HIRAN domain-containing protein [Sulfuricellaceae bacterium]|nr:HIRAN domain-containing protein [Sulfuricellaceae bacterium]
MAFSAEPVVHAEVYLQTSRLAGFKYYEGRKLWQHMQTGDALTLVREPENPYDSNAIRVEWQAHKLGFVPRAENVALARFMDGGQHLTARITTLPREKRRGRKIEFDVYLSK